MYDGKNIEKGSGSGKGSRPLESPERESERLWRIVQQMRRVSPMYKRRGFRGNRGRILVLCLLLILAGGMIFAVASHLRRNSYDTLMKTATELYEAEQYAPAFEAYLHISERYPDRIEPFLGAARSAESIGRVEDAVAAYRSSLGLFPANAAPSRSGVFFEVGRLYSTLKAWDEAMENFEEAVSVDTTNYGAYFSLGNVLEEQEKLEAALEAYKRALDLSPSSQAAQEAIRRISQSILPQEQDFSKQKYEHALQVGTVALGLQRYSEASQYFAEALTIRSDDANAWVGFAEARAHLGDTSGAIKSLQRALERDPDHSDAKTRLSALEESRKPPQTPQRRQRNQRSAPRSSTRNEEEKKTGIRIPLAGFGDRPLSRRSLFDIGIVRYREGRYAEAFDSFCACLRSEERDLLPSASLAGSVGPLWKGFRAKLSVPSDAKLLAEAVRINPEDRDLYLNIFVAGTKMGMSRQGFQAILNDVYAHARSRK